MDKVITDDAPRDQHVTEPASYLELHARPSEEQSTAPSEYEALQDGTETPGYYNSVFEKDGCKNEDDDVYDEIRNAQCWVVSFFSLLPLLSDRLI